MWLLQLQIQECIDELRYCLVPELLCELCKWFHVLDGEDEDLEESGYSDSKRIKV